MKATTIISVALATVFASSQSFAADNSCKGEWTVTGEQKRQLNGDSVPPTVVKIDRYGSYTYGSFYTTFVVDKFPIDVPKTFTPHTLFCKEGVLHLKWVSRRTGQQKEVYFERVTP